MFWELLETTSITAEMEFNVIKKYLVITRSITSCDEHIGPNDALKIIAEESGKYKMIAYYKVWQDTVELPITSNKITVALDNQKADYLKTLVQWERGQNSLILQ